MRINFVGKGGSGKTTISALFASYLTNNSEKPVAVFDADLNIHLPELLGFGTLPFDKHLSHPAVTAIIRNWLVGGNELVHPQAFRKTTPPTRKSNIFRLGDIQNSPLNNFALNRGNLFLFAVGTYQEDDIGASCYHNNLAIFESLLNHTDDRGGYLVADMVAGVDSFAGTLHAQFDMTCLVAEPTRRSVEVFNKYMELAEEAGVSDSLFVIGNKIRNEDDISFVKNNIPKEKLIGFLHDEHHVRQIDQDGGVISYENINSENKKLFTAIQERLDSLPERYQQHLEKLWDMHRKYVGQAFIKERFGDLTNQIDTEFNFNNTDHE